MPGSEYFKDALYRFYLLALSRIAKAYYQDPEPFTEWNTNERQSLRTPLPRGLLLAQLKRASLSGLPLENMARHYDFKASGCMANLPYVRFLWGTHDYRCPIENWKRYFDFGLWSSKISEFMASMCLRNFDGEGLNTEGSVSRDSDEILKVCRGSISSALPDRLDLITIASFCQCRRRLEGRQFSSVLGASYFAI